MANFIVPLFRHLPSVEGVFWQPGQEIYSSYYIGIVPVALALVALAKWRDCRTILLAALASIGFVLACGDSACLLPLLKRIAPWLGFSRYPVKFINITLFCLPLLAASGVASWQSHTDGAIIRRRLWRAGIAVALVLAGVVATAYWHPFPGEEWSATGTAERRGSLSY